MRCRIMVSDLPIRVKAGVYHEKLHMDKPGIHLIGEGAEQDDHHL